MDKDMHIDIDIDIHTYTANEQRLCTNPFGGGNREQRPPASQVQPSVQRNDPDPDRPRDEASSHRGPGPATEGSMKWPLLAAAAMLLYKNPPQCPRHAALGCTVFSRKPLGCTVLEENRQRQQQQRHFLMKYVLPRCGIQM